METSGALTGQGWLAALRSELVAQRRVMTRLVQFCEGQPLASSLSVGCSLGRGAADALSDIDAALGVAAERGGAGAGEVLAVEEALIAFLPDCGSIVDVLRHQVGPDDRFIRRVFAQFANGTQLDLAILAEVEVRRGDAAPDFVPLYEADEDPKRLQSGDRGKASDEFPSAYVVTGEQVRTWAFLGWCGLADVWKYLQRGSPWEVHNRLHDVRHHIWSLWAAATGALYPWHGLSQVLDHDPRDLPPGIEATVAGLRSMELLRAARVSATVLTYVSEAAAKRYPTSLPDRMARHVTTLLSSQGG